MTDKGRGDLELAQQALAEGRAADAKTELARALDHDPECKEALYLLAAVHWGCGEVGEAETCFRRLADLDPDDAIALNNVGLCLLAKGDAQGAEPLFRKAIALSPQSAPFHTNLGIALERMDKVREAEANLRKAVELAPGSADALENLAQLLLRTGDPRAQSFFERASQAEPKSLRGQMAHAHALFMAGDRHEEAATCLEGILEVHPNLSAAHVVLGTVRHELGRFEEGNDSLRSALELDPRDALAHAGLIINRRVRDEDRGLLVPIREMVDDPSRTRSDRRTLEFALAKAYNDLGEFEQAVSHARKAHSLALELTGASYDRTRHATSVDRMIEWFDTELIGSRRSFGSDSDLPVFIFGLPRSGSSLVDHVLGRHPSVAMGGEVTFWPAHTPRVIGGVREGDEAGSRALARDYLSVLQKLGPPKARVTDKQLTNANIAGALFVLFPNARFLCMERSSLDNAISLFLTPMGLPPPYVHRPEDIVFAIRQHERLVSHWRSVLPKDRFRVVSYEVLVEEFKAAVREIVEFCGLPWDDACLDPSANRAAVGTASQWQVRQPVYRSSVDRWRNYGPFLPEFKELLQ